MRASKKLLTNPLVEADFSYLDKFERIQDLKKLTLETTRHHPGYGAWRFLHESFLPDNYTVVHKGISCVKKTTYNSGYNNRRWPTHDVKFFITLGPDGKYNPTGKKKIQVKDTHEFQVKEHSTYRVKPSWHNDLVELHWNDFWMGYHLQWSAARSAVKAKIQKRLLEDPDFANEQKVLGDIDRTKAIMAVMKPLQRLRSATDSLISGIGKGTVSAATLKEWSSAVGSIGKNRMPVLGPIKKYFVNKK